MRYTLRNQEKLKKSFGQEYVNLLLASLLIHFQTHPEIVLETGYVDEPYPIILVENAQPKTDSVFEFYVISITFDVYLLAYKSCMG